MTLETMKELFGIAHVRDDEEEVPTTKHMHIVEEEVSLSQPITTAVPLGLHWFLLEEEFPPGPPIAVPPEDEEVPVLQGPSIVILPEEEVPPEEEEFPAPAVTVQLEEEEVPASLLVRVLPERRGCLVPIPVLVSYSPFFFFSKMQEILLALFLINMINL
jgi:hypothetical protein